MLLIIIVVTSYNTILLNSNVMFSSSVERNNQNLIAFAERVINAFFPQYFHIIILPIFFIHSFASLLSYSIINLMTLTIHYMSS